VRRTLAAAATAFGVATSCGEAEGGGAPAVALSVSPARVALVAPAARSIELRNVGAAAVVVDVVRKTLDRRRPRPNDWFRVRPEHLVLRAGSKGVLTMRVRVNARATPGDHRLLLLVVARPVQRGLVGVRMRLGVGVRIRLPGHVVRRLELRDLRVHTHNGRPLLLLGIGNRGNVTEQLRGRLTVTLVRSGRVVSRLRPRGLRELFPGARTVLTMRYAVRVRGRVTAVVKLRLPGRVRPAVRRYRIRL
jgi:hypothetical protein